MDSAGEPTLDPLNAPVSAWFADAGGELPEENRSNLVAVALPLARWLVAEAQSSRAPLLVGVSGGQGSGKSTLSALLVHIVRDHLGVRALHLSIDDFYLARRERDWLAERIHPLLATRGVPGTHDMALAARVIEAAGSGAAIKLPRFDKAVDDRVSESEWPLYTERAQVILLEGWCVGAAPQEEEALLQPVNRLEAEEDGDGVWRRYVNGCLARGPYRELFSAIDRLVMLRVPDLAAVHRWRTEQEAALQRRRGTDAGIVGTESMARFLAHYERLTRHMLEEMPPRADLLLTLDEAHRIVQSSPRLK